MRVKQMLAIGASLLVIGIVVTMLMTKHKYISKTNFESNSTVFIQFEIDGQIEYRQLDKDDTSQIIEILDDRFEYRENYSCGFSASSAIVIDGVSYYIASDGCPFLLDTSSNLYFKISKENKHEISNIFAKYGGIVYWK